MSTPDYSNPQVLKNFLLSQMKEGKGEFLEKKDVLVFRDEVGNEYVAPDEVREYLDAQKAEELQAQESVAEEPQEEVQEAPKKKAGRPKKTDK